MKHFYKSIPGWFSFAETYRQAVAHAEDGAHFVELGSWKGRSAAFMAVEIINSGKRIQFDCVDTWLGSDEPKHRADPDVRDGTLFDAFLLNTDPVREVVNPIRLPSVEAAKHYQPESLNFVFIDAAHDYRNVKADIAAWFPKVKAGGVLAGDDYGGKGVTKAVHEAWRSGVGVSRGSGSGMQWWVRKDSSTEMVA